MERFVAISSTTTLLGFTIAFSVLLGLVTQRSASIDGDDQILRAVGELSVLSVRVASESAGSLYSYPSNAYIIATDHSLDATTSALSDAKRGGQIDKVQQLISNARRIHRNSTSPFQSSRVVYLEALNSISSLTSSAFADAMGSGGRSNLLLSILSKIMSASSLTLQRELGAYNALISNDVLPVSLQYNNLLRASLSYQHVFDMGVPPQAQWLSPGRYAPAASLLKANISSLQTLRNIVMDSVNTSSTISGSTTSTVVRQLRTMQAGKMDLSSRVVNTLFDRLTSKLTERRNTQRIYMILLAVGIVLSFTFFVLNVAQLLTRSRAIHQTEILLEDFCDIADGEVILKPDTSKIIRYYTSQMCFMDVETLEQASDEPGQIEISLRKACAVLEKLRPFVPRGAYLYSTVVQDQKKIDYACADDTEKDAAELEDVEVTCTRQNLSTTLVNTPAILMLVGTPFLHEGVEDAELVSRLVTLVHEVVDARGGIVVHVSEDGIMCVFNASVDEFTTTREGESDTVLAARDLLSQIEAGTDADALPVVITIASAPCLVGNLIGPITTAFQVVGPNVLRVNALQPVAHRHKVRILTDSHTVHALSSGWHMRPIERMTTDPNDPLNAYEILSQVPDLEEMDEAEKRDIMETEDKIRDRIASWVKAWTLYENAKDHLTDLLDEAGKEFAAYRSVHVPEGDEDPSLDILQRLIRAKLKELLGVDFHDTTKE